MIRNALTTLTGRGLRRLCDWAGLGVLGDHVDQDLSDTIIEALAAYTPREGEAT